MTVVAEGLKIDWSIMPTYNTIMSIAAGAGLLALVLFGKELLANAKDASSDINTDGWSIAFGVLGIILFPMGMHMSLTWPLAAGGFPFDNIVFGETSIGFGALLLFASFYLWRRGEQFAAANPLKKFGRVAQPISWFVGTLGLALFGIAAAGITYQLFAAPAEEPISGWFADYPMVEATFMSLLFALVGVGAVLFPFVLGKFRSGDFDAKIVKVMGWSWAVTGVIFALFGAMNFFTHIGLIVNTM